MVGNGGKNNNAEVRMAAYRAVTRDNGSMLVLTQKAWDATVQRWNGLQRSQQRMVIDTECKSNGHLYADTPLSDERSMRVRMCRRCCADTQEAAA
jgi:hypothetical protein